MKIYTLQKKQHLPITLEDAWQFFSSPVNLKKITPPYMGFEITSDLGDGKMYAGQIITYIVKPVFNIPLKWATEITHVKDREYFVDEQRFGPYKFWHHLHKFESTKDGVLMTDIIHYALPLGILGRIANQFFVKNQLEEIFSFREKIVNEMYPIQK